jgi:hypothetical protein
VKVKQGKKRDCLPELRRNWRDTIQANEGRRLAF